MSLDLTKSEIEHFWECGFVSIENVFRLDEIEAWRSATDDPGIQEDLKNRRAGERTVHLIPITTRHPVFRTLAVDPRITHRIAALIGNDIQLSNSKLAVKPHAAGFGAFDWHQDFAYYTSTNCDLITVSVALDDATSENGGMYALRGSHKLGLLDHTTDGWMTGFCVEPKYWEERPDEVVPMMSKAGGITIHHCLTLHSSPVNRSGNPRRLVIFQYRAGHCYQLSDHTWDDTGYQVLGTPSGRVRCAAMDVVLPKNRRWERYCGEPHGSVYKQIGPVALEWNREPRSADE